MRRRLGRRGLADVGAHLWAADCQSCVQPFGAEAPALVVDELDDVAYASLHHERCRRSQWNDSHLITFAGGRALTFACQAFMLPLFRAALGPGDLREYPALLVNPALERVPLRRDGRGWRSRGAEAYAPWACGPSRRSSSTSRSPVRRPTSPGSS